jgi:hypothetical protein
MRESSSAAQAWVRFCEGVSEGKVDQFDDIVSQEAKLIIGTAPGEIVTELGAYALRIRDRRRNSRESVAYWL